MRLELGTQGKRQPLDSTKHKDTGRDFGAIFRDYHDPDMKELRKIKERRESRSLSIKQDVGL